MCTLGPAPSLGFPSVDGGDATSWGSCRDQGKDERSVGTPSYEGCWNMGVIEAEMPQTPALQAGVTLVTWPVAQEQSLLPPPARPSEVLDPGPQPSHPLLTWIGLFIGWPAPSVGGHEQQVQPPSPALWEPGGSPGTEPSLGSAHV